MQPMENNKIDFSELFSDKAPNTPEMPKIPEKTPSERFLDKGNGFTLPKETLENRRVEGIKTLMSKYERLKAEHEALLREYEKLSTEYEEAATNKEIYTAICANHHQNALKSAELQTAIIKGLNEGQNLTTLFLQAVQAISVMTDCTDFSRIVEETVKAVYGLGLNEKAALAVELADVEKRLERLNAAYGRAEGDEKERINRAITAHQNRISYINNLRSSGKD